MTRSKTTIRRFDDKFIELCIIEKIVNNTPLLFCLLCEKTLANDSSRKNKLTDHLETQHCAYKRNSKDYFKALEKKYNDKKTKTSKITKFMYNHSDNIKYQVYNLFLYKIAYNIALHKKAYTDGE